VQNWHQIEVLTHSLFVAGGETLFWCIVPLRVKCQTVIWLSLSTQLKHSKAKRMTVDLGLRRHNC